MYDTTIGRWISEDPIGFEAADPNLYRYVHNSPLDSVDPSGLQGTGLPPPYFTIPSATEMERRNNELQSFLPLSNNFRVRISFGLENPPAAEIAQRRIVRQRLAGGGD